MSRGKTAKPKVEQPSHRGPASGRRLPEPQSECSTTGLITELSEDLSTILRGRKGRRKDAGDGPRRKAGRSGSR